MTKEFIIEKTKEIGIKKGYDEKIPEDWYGGITDKEFIENKIKISLIKKYFSTKQNLIKNIFPKYQFIDYKFKRSTNNYYNSIDILLKDVVPFYEKLKRIPFNSELPNKINNAIKKHGGKNKISEILGFKESTNGFKALSGNVVKSSYEIILDNFLFLNGIKYTFNKKIIEEENFLYDFKIEDLYIEIWGYENRKGPINEKYQVIKKIKKNIYNKNKLKLLEIDGAFFKKNLFEINEGLKHFLIINKIKVENFYNKDLSCLRQSESYSKKNIFQEIKDVCVKNNFKKMPTRDWLKKNGFKKQVSYLDNNKITNEEIIKELNLDNSNTKPKDYWKNWNNINYELKIICDELGRFPTQKELNVKNIGLSRGISRHHGGLRKTALILGYHNKRKEKKYWVFWKNLKKEILFYYNKNNLFPTSNYLRKEEREDLVTAIYKYYGGILKVKKKFFEEIKNI